VPRYTTVVVGLDFVFKRDFLENGSTENDSTENGSTESGSINAF
jgi:hypothetical protein